jgi:hypothetical protein
MSEVTWRQEEDFLSAFALSSLLSGGSQGSTGSQTISLDNSAAVLLAAAYSSGWGMRDLLPLLIVTGAIQGGGGTQANILLLPFLFGGRFPGGRYRAFEAGERAAEEGRVDRGGLLSQLASISERLDTMQGDLDALRAREPEGRTRDAGSRTR